MYANLEHCTKNQSAKKELVLGEIRGPVPEKLFFLGTVPAKLFWKIKLTHVLGPVPQTTFGKFKLIFVLGPVRANIFWKIK